MSRGVAATVGCYILWGLLPIFWKMIQDIPAFEVLCHRMVWSIVVLLILLTWRAQWRWIADIGNNPRGLILYLLAALFIAVNWYTYIWAVAAGFIVETSLGYFINPLITVLLGMIFLQERLRLWQWVALGVAACGCLHLTFNYGSFPWIALVLAFSFGFYGLLKKMGTLASLEGLSVETAILLIPALIYLTTLELQGGGSFVNGPATDRLLLATTGIITAVPMLLFAYGARRVSMVTLGLLQYIAPSIQLCIGVFIYREPFPIDRMIGFVLIWTAVSIFAVDSMIRLRNVSMQAQRIQRQ
ncbi:MAG: EamA family transporter RarD [Halieaceae bacterium]|jgi:chloramphenicol-sensitive protein RarD|nr:EamA family transporter RarD [Halieaceae bacterium]